MTTEKATPPGIALDNEALDKTYVECRECAVCQHIGINDASNTQAACHSCDWTGTSPSEDFCPGCESGNCMGAACPKCGGIYKLLADASIAQARAAQPQPSAAPSDEEIYEHYKALELPHAPVMWEAARRTVRAVLAAAPSPNFAARGAEPAGMQVAVQPDSLRAAVQQMTRALADGEWADLLTTDSDAAALEAQVWRVLEQLSAARQGQGEPERYEYRVAFNGKPVSDWRETTRARHEDYKKNPVVDEDEEGMLYEVRELYAAPQPTAAPTPQPAMPQGQYIPRNFTTHRGPWRQALEMAISSAPSAQSHDDDDQKAYWQHELEAFDRAFTRLLDKPEPIRTISPQPTAAPTPQAQPAGAPTRSPHGYVNFETLDYVVAFGNDVVPDGYYPITIRNDDLAAQPAGAAPTPHEQEARAAVPSEISHAANAGGLCTDYYARFPEGESWAQVTHEQYEIARRMGYDVRILPPLPDAGALEIACVVNKKLGEVIAGRAYLLPADLAALKRFHECASDFDAGGHDVPKDAMARLREIGVVQSIGFGRHQTTAFGDYVLERCDGEPVKLPLKTLVERNEDSRAAAKRSAALEGDAA